MKIAIFVSELDIRGGTHKQVLKLSDYLKDQGHDVFIVTPIYTPGKTYDGFSRHRVISCSDVRRRRSGLLGLVAGLIDSYKLFNLVRNTDIVNVHDANSTLFILLCSFFTKAKVVWQINDIEPAFGIGNSKGYKGRTAIFRRYFSRLAAARVEKITVNVSKNAERVSEFLGQAADVVYCGVDFLPKRKQLKLEHNKVSIVSTGVVFPYRNYETLIKAAAYHSRTHTVSVRLDIIGDISHDLPYAQRLKDLAGELKVEVNLHGSVRQDVMENIYRSATLFAFLNVDQSWGLAVFEAASMGIPVLLSKSVGAVELLHDAGGIFIVDPLAPEEISEAIRNAIHDDQLYQHLCNDASASVENMSWDKMYSSVIEAKFSHLISGKPPN